MEILKFRDWNIEYLIESSDIEEGSGGDFKEVLRKISRDLNFNTSLIFSFGTGIGFMYPIVENLIKNGNIKIDLNVENITLLCLTVLCIIYLEEKREGLKKSDVKRMMKEVQLRTGLNNTSDGLINKLVKIFNSIFKEFKNIVNKIPKYSKWSLKSLLDMFAYTSLLVPVLNFVNLMIGNYNLTVDNFIGNLASLTASLITLIIKNGYEWFLNKMSKNKDIKEVEKEENILS